MPVAWTLLPANPPHAWRRAWRRRLRPLRPAMPPGWTVSGLAERGLSAGWWCRRLVRWGWHPCLRSSTGEGPVAPDPQATDRPWTSGVPRPGTRWPFTGPAVGESRQRPLRGPWLACWAAGASAPWLIRTELPPEASAAGWEGRRAFRRPGTQRAGWPWQRTRMTQPARAAQAVAGRGGRPPLAAERGRGRRGGHPAAPAAQWDHRLGPQRRQRRATRRRLGRIVRRGWVAISGRMAPPSAPASGRLAASAVAAGVHPCGAPSDP